MCYSVDLESGKITKHVTWKGVQKGEFSKINNKLIDKIESHEVVQLENYNWKRTLNEGIQYVAPDCNVKYDDDDNKKRLSNVA